MRKPILAANWKMHKTVAEAVRFAEEFAKALGDEQSVDAVIAPPFHALAAVGPVLAGCSAELSAQNVHPEEKGAFTGEISPGMLADLGCGYTIVGHSERRALFGEDDAFIARKAAALLAHQIRPIVCVGESLEDREANRTLDVVGGQLQGSLAEIPSDRAAEIVVAYEPVWAIGTGRTATPEIAQEVHGFIRERLSARFGPTGAEIRIQYGGSVKPDNIRELMAQADIDGALVGGASLDATSFLQIVTFGRSEGSA